MKLAILDHQRVPRGETGTPGLERALGTGGTLLRRGASVGVVARRRDVVGLLGLGERHEGQQEPQALHEAQAQQQRPEREAAGQVRHGVFSSRSGYASISASSRAPRASRAASSWVCVLAVLAVWAVHPRR